MGFRPLARLGFAVALSVLTSGCVRSMAINGLADAMASNGGGMGTDEDPELVQAAAPFGLKTMEGLLVEVPEHVGLLTSLASGFVQYGYAFVEQEAARIEEDDFRGSERLRRRATKLYLRGRRYALRGLELRHEGISVALLTGQTSQLASLEVEDVPLLYWTAAAWGLTIANSLDQPDRIGELPLVAKLGQRALELDPGFMDGAIHELFITLEASSPGGDLAVAEAHFDKAIAMSAGGKAGPFVTLAEKVAVKKQDAAAFKRLLNTALSIDINARPNDRLANVIMQRRAKRLLSTIDDLIPGAEDGVRP